MNHEKRTNKKNQGVLYPEVKKVTGRLLGKKSTFYLTTYPENEKHSLIISIKAQRRTTREHTINIHPLISGRPPLVSPHALYLQTRTHSGSALVV